MKVSREQVIAYRVARAATAPHRRQAARARGARHRRAGRRPASRPGWPSTPGCRNPRGADAVRAGRRRSRWSGRCAVRRTCTGAATWTSWPARSTRCPRPMPRSGSNETGPSVARAGIAALEQFATAVEAMRDVGAQADGKGAVSTAVTKAIPKPMRRACRACKTSHISDSAMRASFLAAGLELQPDTAPPVLQRRKGAQARRPKPDLERADPPRARLPDPARPGDAGAGRRLPRRAPRRSSSRPGPTTWSRCRSAGTTAWLPAECRAGARVAAGAGAGAAARRVRPVPAGARPRPDRPGQVGAQGAVAGARPSRRGVRRRRGGRHVAAEGGRQEAHASSSRRSRRCRPRSGSRSTPRPSGWPPCAAWN